MFDAIFLEQLSRGVPQTLQAKFLKYALIVGVDKLAKKGLMSPFDLKAIKGFVQQVKRQGRIELDDSKNSIKREIQNLKQEINNLAKNLENKKSIVSDPSQIDILPRSSSTKRPKQQKKEDSRKRASSFDYKKTQEKRGHEITPKVTEVYPQQPNQIFQNFNINISKHHLDDTQIKEIFQNQSKLNETSEQKRLQSRPLKHKQSVVNKNFSNLSINYRNKENRPQMPDPQRVKELYEQQLKEQVQNKSLAVSQAGYMNLSRNADTSLNVSRNEKQEKNERRDSKRKSQQKKIQYDPHAQINDLPYKQVQPQSKVKADIEQAKRNYKMMQEQTEQQSNKSQRALRDVSESILNTANFSKKQTPQDQYQLRQPQYPGRQDTFYKSTVTLNEDYLNDQEYPDTEENDQDQPFDDQYQDQYQGEEYEEEPAMLYNMAAPQIHSSSFSQQGTKRSQTKEEPQSQQKPMQQNQYTNGEFKSKERQQSQSSQQISNLQSEYHSFYPNSQNQVQVQKYLNRDQPKKQATQQSQDLSSQKMSAQLSAQQQSNLWERNSRQQRTNPFNQDDMNRSSFSSNFSMFTPDDELKNFFQKDFIERKININQSSDLNVRQLIDLQQSKQSMTSSSQQSEQALGRPMVAQSNGDEQWFKKRSVESSQPDDIVRSNVFNNNRLSGTRGFNNSQF